MKAVLCGVRGSTASPGPEFARTGGHTSCVAVAHDAEPPTLLLDAGTGIRRVTHLLDHGPVALGPGPHGHGPYHEAAEALADGVDVLIHDAQLTASELEAFAGYGHSTIDYATGLAAHAGARTLILFHHSPSRTDDALDRIAAEIDPSTAVVVGREPMELVLPIGPRT